MQICVYTLSAMNGQSKTLPVAFFISSSQTAESVQHFLESVRNIVQKEQADFRPGSIRFDDDQAERLAIV